jgi:hypothetical protein
MCTGRFCKKCALYSTIDRAVSTDGGVRVTVGCVYGFVVLYNE